MSRFKLQPPNFSFFTVTLVLASCLAHAEIVTFGEGSDSIEMEFVEIGNPGNPHDLQSIPPNVRQRVIHPPMGAVDYRFKIGKFELSCEQQLAVPTEYWWNHPTDPPCFQGVSKPGFFGSGGEAAGWINGLNEMNGFPPAYKIVDDGFKVVVWEPGDPGYDPQSPFRNSQARFALPNHNEFHKAAYYNPEEGRYQSFSTGDQEPTNSGPFGSRNPGTVVFDQFESVDVQLAGGESPYGTVGQIGNGTEWEETNPIVDSYDGFFPALRAGAQDAAIARQLHAKSSRRTFTTHATLRVVMLEPTPNIEGDFNFDNNVDFGDFLTLAQHFGKRQVAFAKYHHGDANGDLLTDFQDFRILAENFGKTFAPPITSPELQSAIDQCNYSQASIWLDQFVTDKPGWVVTCRAFGEHRVAEPSAGNPLRHLIADSWGDTLDVAVTATRRTSGGASADWVVAEEVTVELLSDEIQPYHDLRWYKFSGLSPGETYQVDGSLTWLSPINQEFFDSDGGLREILLVGGIPTEVKSYSDLQYESQTVGELDPSFNSPDPAARLGNFGDERVGVAATVPEPSSLHLAVALLAIPLLKNRVRNRECTRNFQRACPPNPKKELCHASNLCLVRRARRSSNLGCRSDCQF